MWLMLKCCLSISLNNLIFKLQCLQDLLQTFLSFNQINVFLINYLHFFSQLLDLQLIISFYFFLFPQYILDFIKLIGQSQILISEALNTLIKCFSDLKYFIVFNIYCTLFYYAFNVSLSLIIFPSELDILHKIKYIFVTIQFYLAICSFLLTFLSFHICKANNIQFLLFSITSLSIWFINTHQSNNNLFMRRTRKIQLPVNFAQQILDCEIQIKLSPSPPPQIIKKMIELYSLGVQYFQSIRSYKYLYFHQKMNQLLMSSMINNYQEPKKVECESPIRQKLKSNCEQQKIEAIKIKQKQQQMLNQIVEKTLEFHTGSGVKQILQKTEESVVKAQQKIKQQMDDQEKLLKDKLSKRKSRVFLAKSLSMVQHSKDKQTKESLCIQSLPDNKGFNLKPLQVSFTSVINENDSDQDEENFRRSRKQSFASARNKFKSQSTLPQKDIP